MDRWLQAAQGFLKVVTLAPERPGAIPLVDHLVRQGVRVSLGHSAADPSAVAQAVTAGATLVTHLYNAMGDLSGRRPGLVGAALAMPALTVEVIADGHHVDPVAIQAAYRAKGPGGMVGITDAITPAGLEGDGAFRLLGQPIEVRGGRVASPDGVLAGSALTLDVAARNLTAWLGLAPWELAQLLSATPARVLGLERKGRIAPGADADFTLVDDAGRVRRTVVGGRTVYRAPNPQGAGGGARTAP
jgi:N-acetylglucosamine-6-phosphate deacetylase